LAALAGLAVPAPAAARCRHSPASSRRTACRPSVMWRLTQV
jgi:hypothetical protein